MEGKIIVLDVDGTLMPSSNVLDKDTTEYLVSLEKNNTVVLASSRGYHDLITIHDRLGLNGPIIANNGGSLDFFDGHQSVCMSIDTTTIATTFKKHKEIIVSAFYSYHQKLFIYNRLEQLSFLYKITEQSEVIEGPFDEVNLDCPNSIYFILDNTRKQEFFDTIEQYKNEISYYEYGHDKSVSITIVTLKNTNKAYAVLELLLILKKNEEDLIVFGDGEVDISMLKLNGITVAMCNAPDEVKSAAKFITDFDNNHQGVLKFLQKIDNK